MITLIFNRIWAMPNKHTFQIKPIKELISRYYYVNEEDWLNPFANNSKYGITNDLNPEFNTDHNEDYKTFLKRYDKAYGIFLDPPFSAEQISRSYKNIGLKASMQDTQGFYSRAWDEIIRINPTIVIQCGWHTNGRKEHYNLIELLMVPHGGMHYDTLVSVWHSKNEPLDKFF